MKEPGWLFGNRPTPRLLWQLWKTGPNHVLRAERAPARLGDPMLPARRVPLEPRAAVAGTREAEAEANKRELISVDGY